MRASRGGPHEEGGRHLSGAERLARAEELEQVALELLRRGRATRPDHLRVSIDRLTPGSVQSAPCLPITTIEARDPEVARIHAEEALLQAGVRPEAVDAGFRLLREGVHGDGRAIAGAVLLDSRTGKRAASTPERGVRASRFDYAAEVRAQVRAAQEAAGLGHFRTFEAVALATKVIWAGILAELCWSDAPEYVAGYVATLGGGYVRFPRFKPQGTVGGRIFYLPGDADLSRLTERLTRLPLLIDTVPEIR
jgi:6-carboxyhexanoate--CoA ligase